MAKKREMFFFLFVVPSTRSHPRLAPRFTHTHTPFAESAMKKIEDDNTLVFIVDKLSNKPQVRV